MSSLKGNNGIIPAVDGVSFYIKENETMGLVGESGCGKTTIGRIILRLTTPTSGRVIFDGRDISALSARWFRPLRKQIQMIFQDLDAVINPRMRIRDILKEAITVHHQLSGSEIDHRMSELLEDVNFKKGKLSNFPY